MRPQLGGPYSGNGSGAADNIRSHSRASLAHVRQSSQIVASTLRLKPLQPLATGYYMAHMTTVDPHPSQERTIETFQGLLLESQRQNLALTVLHLPSLLDSGYMTPNDRDVVFFGVKWTSVFFLFGISCEMLLQALP